MLINPGHLAKMSKVYYLVNLGLKTMAIHFVGFTGDEYNRAIRIFGYPDFIHRFNDPRFRYSGEIMLGDMVIFANRAESLEKHFSYDDSAYF